MALAVLCSRIQNATGDSHTPSVNAQFYGLGSVRNLKFRAFVVDHGVRIGSDVEAEAVSQVLQGRGSFF